MYVKRGGCAWMPHARGRYVAWNLVCGKFGILLAAEMGRIKYNSESIKTNIHLPFVEDEPVETSATL
jgi:hypothetical protein